MPKYKYVDGVKYRVVPQSVLGYALVREGPDNSLPAGGTDGQVLAKASNADYDVEWSTVESGAGIFRFDYEVEFVSENEYNVVPISDPSDLFVALSRNDFVYASEYQSDEGGSGSNEQLYVERWRYFVVDGSAEGSVQFGLHQPNSNTILNIAVYNGEYTYSYSKELSS